MRRLIFWSLLPLVLPQALLLRRRAPRFPPAPGPTSGLCGAGAPLRMLALGDSIIAGVGAPSVRAALPGQVAERLAEQLGREVHWQASGRIGATAAGVRDRLVASAALQAPVDLVLLSVGVNDVISLRTTRQWRRDLRALIALLRERCRPQAIALLGLPPLSGFPLLPQPLRSVIGLRGRIFDALAIEWAQRSGVIHVPVRFRPRPERFSADGFHPSPEGYRELGGLVADALRPTWPSPASAPAGHPTGTCAAGPAA